MEILLWIIAGVWAGHTLLTLAALRLVPELPPLAGPARAGPPPRVTAVVAARDEEDRIAQTAGRLLSQTGVDLALVVVDDRSADATPEILAGLASTHPAMTVRRVETLPDGWLGKCHACQVGAEDARGEWILFIDADVWLEPDTVARALAASVGRPHVTLIPGFARSAGLGKPAVLACLMPFLTQSAMANLGVPGQAVGIGGFNLVRTDLYRKLGGHTPLRLEIVDDLYLARLAARSGGRTRVFRGFRAAEVEYAATLRGLLAVTQKNNFAIFRFRPIVSVLSVIAFVVLWAGALAGPLVAPGAGWWALGALALTAFPAGLVARSVGWPVWAALPVPFLHAVMPMMLLNSMISTYRAGGVRWRETRYPLKKLRAGRVR